jgi:hypothetical protein
MDDSEKSFAAKYGFNTPKNPSLQKNIVKPAAKQLVPTALCRRTYKITTKNEEQLKQLEKKIEATLQTGIGQSALIRGLITLAATNGQVQEQLVSLLDYQRVPWGRPRKKP